MRENGPIENRERGDIDWQKKMIKILTFSQSPRHNDTLKVSFSFLLRSKNGGNLNIFYNDMELFTTISY